MLILWIAVGIMVLRRDGTVWIMGTNLRGNLGQCDFKNNFYKGFVQVKNLKEIKQINSQMALDEQGYIWAWGGNINPPYTHFFSKTARRHGKSLAPSK
ncbi:MAG: hypothetical protein IPL02_12485 [Moraxellaceae bacterium]|nr:hypothetical protein [Moraxellaceae bacterium]